MEFIVLKQNKNQELQRLYFTMEKVFFVNSDILKNVRGDIKMSEETHRTIDWEHIAIELWKLLDDIDAASDLFKPVKNDFYKYTMVKVTKRFEFMESDGYNLFPKEKEQSYCEKCWEKYADEMDAISGDE